MKSLNGQSMGDDVETTVESGQTGPLVTLGKCLKDHFIARGDKQM